VIEETALSYSVSRIGEKEIDKINILNASIKAMHQAVKKLSVIPDKLIIDGNRFKDYKNIPHKCIIKGDGIYYSIAAASVLAKEYRDDYMKNLAKKFPCYCWEANKGYPTKQHRKAIMEHGNCKHHRQSFRLLPNKEQLEISFADKIK
jgi:ribonuclease HII